MDDWGRKLKEGNICSHCCVGERERERGEGDDNVGSGVSVTELNQRCSDKFFKSRNNVQSLRPSVPCVKLYGDLLKVKLGVVIVVPRELKTVTNKIGIFSVLALLMLEKVI